MLLYYYVIIDYDYVINILYIINHNINNSSKYCPPALVGVDLPSRCEGSL